MIATLLCDGRYQLCDVLGEGGMGRVYRGWDFRLRVWRAIKVLEPTLARRAKLRARFETEAHAMAGIEHANVVKVYDVGTDGDVSYMVMELAEGGALVDWLEQHGPMPPKLAVDVLADVCAGIQAAHDANIIHRDIKPHNVLISKSGEVRITDFGIAQLQTEDGLNLTRTGATMGTLGFMSPEQRNDAKHVDVRADVYSLCATLFTLLTNRTVMDLFAATQDLEMLRGVPAKLIPLVVKGTDYRVERRFATVNDLVETLAAIRPSLPENPPDTPSLVLRMPQPPPVPERGEMPTAIPNTQVTKPDKTDATWAGTPAPVPRQSGPEQRQEPQGEQEEPSEAKRDGPAALEQVKASTAAPDVEAPEAKNIAIKKEQGGEPVKGAVGVKRAGTGGSGGDGDVLEPIQMLWGFVTQFSELALRFVVGPGKFIFMPLIVVGVIFGLMIMAGRAQLAAAWVELDAARDVFVEEVATSEAVLADLEAGGATMAVLEREWAAFNEAEGYDKAEAARDYIETAQRQAAILDAAGARRSVPTFVKSQLKIEEMAKAEKRYDKALLVWQEALEAPRAQMVVSLGVDTRPEFATVMAVIEAQ